MEMLKREIGRFFKRVLAYFLTVVVLCGMINVPMYAQEEIVGQAYVYFVSYVDSPELREDMSVCVEKAEKLLNETYGGTEIFHVADKEVVLKGNQKDYTKESIVKELMETEILTEASGNARLILVMNDGEVEKKQSLEQVENILPESWKQEVEVFNCAAIGIDTEKEVEQNVQDIQGIPESCEAATYTKAREMEVLTKISVLEQNVDIDTARFVKLYYNVGINLAGTIEVYNEEGKMVKRIYDKVYHAAGYYLATWNGTDEQGRRVDPGSYIMKLTFGDEQKEIGVKIITGEVELTNVHLESTEVSSGELVKIYYNISKNSYGDIRVYNENGEEVCVIYDNVPHKAGYYLATWNGRDKAGKLVSDGSYVIKIKFGSLEEYLKVNLKSQSILKNIALPQSTVNIEKNEIVRLYYSVEQAGKGSIEVFNAEGTEVKTIYDNVNHGVMRYLATWNGTDDAGAKVSAGEYTIKLQFGSDIQEVKVVIQREEIVLSSLRVTPEEVNREESTEVRIYYQISKACKGTIGIYDENDQLIKEIYNEFSHEKGYYYAFWNLKDKMGTVVSPGKYTAKLKFELNGEIAEAELNIKVVGNEESVKLTNVKIKSDTVNLEKGEKAEVYYALDKAASGNIYVCDQDRKTVKNIYKNFTHASGYYLAYWDGTDESGKKVAGGVYTIKLEFSDETSKVEAEVEVRILDGFELFNVSVEEDSFNINVEDNAKIYYAINKDSYGSIGIYNKDGKKVKEIYNKVYHASGYYLATWNKKDDSGKQVPVGEYSIRIVFERSGAVTEEIVKVRVSDELTLTNVRFSKEEAGLKDTNVKIYYKVTRDCVGDIEIYNETGKKVYTLYDDVKHAAGYYSAFWTFVDENGEKVSPGFYTFKLKFTDGEVVKEKEAELIVNEGIRKVWIDAGHGGSDVGAVNGTRYERDDNLRLALEVQRVLSQQGIKVYMSRIDVDAGYSAAGLVSLKKRVENANVEVVDVFVSLHRDSAGSAARGYTVYTHNANNPANNNSSAYDNKNAGCMELATALNAALANANTFKSRGIVYGSAGSTEDLLVNRVSNMPSCLLEMGFISNSSDNAIFDTYLKTNAKAVAKGIMDYLKEPFDETKYTIN